MNSSLIICEGISVDLTRNTEIPVFPHYMWGYIGRSSTSTAKRCVPSLYVRVYRRYYVMAIKHDGSLIICEGISYATANLGQIHQFPHYMWGYIVLILCGFTRSPVPSLYVRVYHRLEVDEMRSVGSLIICEGISQESPAAKRPFRFPHYMWGYIDRRNQKRRIGRVPSLYVRVYRAWALFWRVSQSSLIICEGISVTPPSDSRCQAFHHYM